MPLQTEKGPNYTKITKVYIDSADRADGSRTAYDYRVKLLDEIQFVTGMELTSYNFPDEVTPSFRAQNKNQPGTDKLDFYIDDGTNIGVFTATWAQRRFNYTDSFDVYKSYCDVIETIMEEAIASDPIFGDAGSYNITWETTIKSDQTTQIEIRKSGGAPPLNWGFLFLTGDNQQNSSHEPMGFEKADYEAISPNTSITSPNPVNLEPYRYFDIVVEEARELNPLARIFVTSNEFYGIVQNEINVSRTRLLSTEPVRRLGYISIRIVLEGGYVLSSDSSTADHDLGITVFSVANENSVPAWISQTFVL